MEKKPVVGIVMGSMSDYEGNVSLLSLIHILSILRVDAAIIKRKKVKRNLYPSRIIVGTDTVSYTHLV